MDNPFRVTRHATRSREAPGRRPGFTVLELAVVMIIVGVIATIALPRMGNMQASQAAQNARDAFVWMGSRARARAIEQGTTQLLEINPAAARAWIVKRNPTSAADTAQVVDFAVEYQATVTSSTGSGITLCYNPRGYAWDCDTDSPDADVQVTFQAGPRTAVARVRPLGQIERQ